MSFDSSKERKRLPEWLRTGLIDSEKTRKVRKLLAELNLNTVCDGARCPNKCECYTKNTATFMILGDKCTRDCKFCAVGQSDKPVYDLNEATNVAIAVKKLGLKYVVITSVTRDDLEDCGAGHFVKTVQNIKDIDSNVAIEVLVPDFKGDKTAIEKVIDSGINVFNHNIETVKELYDRARPQAIYKRSLEVLRYAKEYNPNIVTKSGFMVGLGETEEQVEILLQDLSGQKCDIVTIGQYIQPTKRSIIVDRYYTEEEFSFLKTRAFEIGLKKVVSGPLVRSSYRACETYLEVLEVLRRL